jgi:hypothetical protein
MRDRIAAQAHPQRRRDYGRAVELLERPPLALGREIAGGPLERDGDDAPIRVGGDVRGTERAGVAARMPGRQRVGEHARRRCGRRRRQRRHEGERR